jgi:hypothetical protein
VVLADRNTDYDDGLTLLRWPSLYLSMVYDAVNPGGGERRHWEHHPWHHVVVDVEDPQIR